MLLQTFIPVAILTHAIIALNLPANPTLLPATRDPCKDRPPSTHGYPQLPFWTRIRNEEIFFNLTNINDVLDPSYKTEVLENLDFIRTAFIAGYLRPLYQHGWVAVEWTPGADPREDPMQIWRRFNAPQAANVITTICSLVSSYGPAEMRSIISDGHGEQLARFVMLFHTDSNRG